jgi:hypothetical protein
MPSADGIVSGPCPKAPLHASRGPVPLTVTAAAAGPLPAGPLHALSCHHSQELPSVSYSPKSSGRGIPTGCSRLQALLTHQAYVGKRSSASPVNQRFVAPARQAYSHSTLVGRRHSAVSLWSASGGLFSTLEFLEQPLEARIAADGV